MGYRYDRDRRSSSRPRHPPEYTTAVEVLEPGTDSDVEYGERRSRSRRSTSTARIRGRSSSRPREEYDHGY